MEQAIEEFKKYTNSYLKFGDMCKLKVDHTFRVMNLCEEIANDLNLSDDDVLLAKLCGLLHDIARFEQWKLYQTFSDSQSIDHGDLGVEILLKDNFIRKFYSNEEYDSIVLAAIKYHNKYSILNILTEKEKLFTKILRDADKIDILYLYSIGDLGINLKDELFSESVLNDLKNKNSIYRGHIKNTTDRLAVSLGFIFDINYKESIRIISDNSYYDKEIDLHKEKVVDGDLKNQLEDIRNLINNYIKERLEDVR